MALHGTMRADAHGCVAFCGCQLLLYCLEFACAPLRLHGARYNACTQAGRTVWLCTTGATVPCRTMRLFEALSPPNTRRSQALLCARCARSFSCSPEFVDLTVTSGIKQKVYNQKQWGGTELFRCGGSDAAASFRMQLSGVGPFPQRKEPQELSSCNVQLRTTTIRSC